MTTNEMIKLIDLQYNEILTFLTQIIQGNNKLFTHVYNFKRFYFMETNDFIDAIMVKGKDVLMSLLLIFHQPILGKSYKTLYKSQVSEKF